MAPMIHPAELPPPLLLPPPPPLMSTRWIGVVHSNGPAPALNTAVRLAVQGAIGFCAPQNVAPPCGMRQVGLSLVMVDAAVTSWSNGGLPSSWKVAMTL